MTNEQKAVAFDAYTALQAQLNNANNQIQQTMPVIQAVAQMVGATEGTKLEDLPNMLKQKLAEKPA
ncbi:hypothetical protein IT774_07660 [Salinimonas marina]|uniref:Uncharacterized protein n=1 Tax=Salinimonas marina TaxID=2785918 RepID=A0A7S9DZT7_9ALTE|nr:hypothetical protein [Salinimonas marina]QPG06971.1 hypothetical protein IT774_07660 [Salinimonas marina]